VLLCHVSPRINQNAAAKPIGSASANRMMVAMRRRSVTSNTALRLSFLARSLTA